jgi:hypothetical protein
MPIVEQARKHTPDNDRCMSQYGLPVDERGRSVEVSSATECVWWTVRKVAVLSWGLKRGGGPHMDVTAGSRVLGDLTKAREAASTVLTPHVNTSPHNTTQGAVELRNSARSPRESERR